MTVLPRNEIRISITSACNMRCIYCHNEGNTESTVMNTDMIRKIVSGLKGRGLEWVRITGGEPLVHDDIEQICCILAKDYNLKIGINTNAILIEKLLYLISLGYIKRVVVGLDYFSAPVSKNSPIGVSSETILNNILAIQKTGVDVCIDVVYDENDENIYKLVEWSLKQHIRIKIIERVVINANDENTLYEKLITNILEKFKLVKVEDDLGEVNGYYEGFRAVSFFHSFCRLRACTECRKLPVRITSSGIIKGCILHDDYDIPVDEQCVYESIRNVMDMYISCRDN